MTNGPKIIGVTGASGFIGGYVVHSFFREFHVVALPRDVVNTRGINAIIHLGGIAHRTASAHQYAQANTATARLLSLAKRDGVDHFVFMSSIAAQSGAKSKTVLTESDIPRPVSDYGKAKLAAEKLVQKSGVPFTILRPVAVTGPGAKGNQAKIAKIASVSLPLPFGRVDAKRSIVAVEDLVSAIHRVLLNPAAYGEIYIVAGQAQSLKEMLAACSPCRARIFNISPKILGVAFSLIGLRSEWDLISSPLVADAAKLKSLGWESGVRS